MFTLKDFMLAEAEGLDPQEEMAQKQDKMISLVSDIRKIMSSISMSEVEDAAEDPQAFTFIDLIEALNTTEEVIRDRLSDEGAMVNIPSSRTNPKKQQNIAAKGREWQGDEKKDFAHLFDSISNQVKDTIRNYFAIPQTDEHTGKETSVLPRFVHSYNQLVVDKLIEALKTMGPEAGRDAIGGIIDSAKKAVISQERSQGSESSAESAAVLTKYRQARSRTIAKKQASARTKRDRMKLIKAVAQSMNAHEV